MLSGKTSSSPAMMPATISRRSACRWWSECAAPAGPGALRATAGLSPT